MNKINKVFIVMGIATLGFQTSIKSTKFVFDRTETGEASFAWEGNQKHFSRKNSLRRLMLTHTTLTLNNLIHECAHNTSVHSLLIALDKYKFGKFYSEEEFTKTMFKVLQKTEHGLANNEELKLYITAVIKELTSKEIDELTAESAAHNLSACIVELGKFLLQLESITS